MRIRQPDLADGLHHANPYSLSLLLFRLRPSGCRNDGAQAAGMRPLNQTIRTSMVADDAPHRGVGEVPGEEVAPTIQAWGFRAFPGHDCVVLVARAPLTRLRRLIAVHRAGWQPFTDHRVGQQSTDELLLRSPTDLVLPRISSVIVWPGL